MIIITIVIYDHTIYIHIYGYVKYLESIESMMTIAMTIDV
jgi:hypothetical protein